MDSMDGEVEVIPVDVYLSRNDSKGSTSPLPSELWVKEQKEKKARMRAKNPKFFEMMRARLREKVLAQEASNKGIRQSTKRFNTSAKLLYPILNTGGEFNRLG